MSGNLARRLSLAEEKIGVGKGDRLAVLHRPDGMDAATQAAWTATEPEQATKAALTVIIRHFGPWPPRTPDDVRSCLRSGLCATPADLAVKVRGAPAYAEQTGILACIAGLS